MPKAIKESDLAGPTDRPPDRENRYYLYCPGCFADAQSKYPDEPRFWMNSAIHCFSTSVHGFNGNLDAPTLTPSLLCRYDFGEEKTPYCCHSFVRDGKIQFLSDCTHSLAGQTVDLMDIPDALLRSD